MLPSGETTSNENFDDIPSLLKSDKQTKLAL